MAGVKAAETGFIPYEMFAAVEENDDRAELNHWRNEARRQLDQSRMESKRRAAGRYSGV